MVHRGKRADKCAACIQRRIRCDRREGGCSQCSRMKIVCSGYPDGSDLAMPMHLIQTNDTMRRHGGKAVALDVYHERRPFDGCFQPARTPSQNLDDIAIAYCYKLHFVSNGSVLVDERVLACMKALGMASYSYKFRSAELRKYAYDYYAAALRQVNVALQSTADAATDSVLLQVMILSCYESVAGSSLSRQSLQEWSTHVRGMAALLRLRGARQLLHLQGQVLFLIASGFILSDCVRSGIPVPAAVHEMLDLLAHFDARFRSMPLTALTANLKADIMQQRPINLEAIITRAQKLDHEFSLAYQGISLPYFEYQTYALATWPDSQLPAYLYSYQTMVSAIMWNTMRTGRLLCHGIIADMLGASRIDRHLQFRIEDASRTIRMLQLDILASIPQFLYMAGVNSWSAVNLILSQPIAAFGTPMFARDDLPRINLPILQIGRNYNLVFNLALVGRLADFGSDVRKAVCNTLDYIGRSLGLSLAFHFKSVLEKNSFSHSVIGVKWEGDTWSLESTARERSESGYFTNIYQELSF